MGTQPDDNPYHERLSEERLEPEPVEPEPVEPEQLELEERAPSSGDKFWLRLGFPTHEAWIAYLEELNSVDISGRREIPDIGVPSLAEVSRGVLERELAERRGYRQVGIKLRPVDYDKLTQAADAHGVAPSTLARILTARGARALAGGEPNPPPRNQSAA